MNATRWKLQCNHIAFFYVHLNLYYSFRLQEMCYALSINSANTFCAWNIYEIAFVFLIFEFSQFVYPYYFTHLKPNYTLTTVCFREIGLRGGPPFWLYGHSDRKCGMETFRGQWHLVDTIFENGRLLVDILKGWLFVDTFGDISWTILV